MNPQDITHQAMKKALDIRKAVKRDKKEPVCVYDVGDRLGLEIRFVDNMPSMEGMYSKSLNLILVSSLRPYGRQAFTCAHELGHHVFGHGEHITNNDLTSLSDNSRFSQEEFLANQFASFLLMPKSAIDFAFTNRKLQPNTCNEENIFAIAGYFGVGYTTLIYHMRDNLKSLSPSKASILLKTSPKKIRASIWGSNIEENIFIVNSHWINHTVDIQVGDILLTTPNATTNKDCIQLIEHPTIKKVFKAMKPGITKLSDNDCNMFVYVRVSRPNYAGRNIFRHQEDPDYVSTSYNKNESI